VQVTFPALGGVGLGSEFYGAVSETEGVDTVLAAVRLGLTTRTDHTESIIVRGTVYNVDGLGCLELGRMVRRIIY
jgi:hypothetical protein